MKILPQNSIIISLIIIFGIKSGYSCDDPNKKLIKSGGLSLKQKKAILDVHNNYRSAVALGNIHGQPKAQNMLELKWDDELAAKAQIWAEECKIAHDPDRHIDRFPVGQNLAATWTTYHYAINANTEPDFTDSINQWFDEVKKFQIDKNGFTPGTGHYSQIVWSETSLIGCGYSFFHDNTRGYTKLYICNYGPAGNIIGNLPYNIGAPACQDFGLIPSRHYPGLCENIHRHFYPYYSYLG